MTEDSVMGFFAYRTEGVVGEKNGDILMKQVSYV